MASDVSRTYLRALGIPAARLDLDALQERGTGNTDSKYQEASPISGVPEANQSTHMVLEASGTPSQEGHLLLTAQRAGMPDSNGAGYYFSDESATTAVDYGHDGAQLVTGWEALLWTDAAGYYSSIPAVIRLASGDLLAVAVQANSAGLPIAPHRYDPSTSTWSALSTVTAPSPEQQGQMALVQLPAGRVLLFLESGSNKQIDVMYSDDDGSSWANYATRVLPEEVDPGAAEVITGMAAAYSSGEVMLALATTDSGTYNLRTYGSASMGTGFIETQADWATATTENPRSVALVAGAAGGFVLAYGDDTGSGTTYRARRTASALIDPSSSPSLVIQAGGASSLYPSLALWRDEDGALFALVVANGGVGTIRWSEDDGLNWTSFGGEGLSNRGLDLHGSGATTNRLDSWACASTGGRTAMLTRWVTTGNEDPQSVGCLWLGGHSTHTAPLSDSALSDGRTDYIVFNERTSDSSEGGLWLPIEEPNNVNWTLASAATFSATLASPGKMRVDTGTASSSNYYERKGMPDASKAFLEFDLAVIEGGSTTGSDVFIGLYLYDGTNNVEVYLRFSTTGVAAYDSNAGATVNGTLSIDTTTRTRYRIAISTSGDMIMWTAQGDPEHVRNWTERSELTGSIQADAGTPSTGSTGYHFGHLTCDAISDWYMVGYCNWPGSWGPSSTDFANEWTTPDDLHPRSFGTTPQLVYDGVRVAAKSGPAKIADSWEIQQDAEYPAANMLWQVHPSPQAAHRTVTDESEVLYTFALHGLAAGLGHLSSTSIFCMVEGINWKLGFLESSTDGTSWTTQISLDAGTDHDTGLLQTRSGEVFSPTKGGAAHKAIRYLHAGELVGGTLKLSGGELREIVENTSGAWTDETAAVPYIQCKNVANGDPTSGAVEIWAPRCLGYKHEISTQHRYWRLRIPASEATAQGYLKTGQLVIGRLHAFGQQYGRGFSVAMEPQIETETLRSGSTRARRAGPPLRQVEIGWPDASDASGVQSASPVPDYITGSTSGVPLASRGDVLRSLAGQVGQQGASPVVFLPKVDRGTGEHITTDRELMLWGRVDSPVVRTNVIGDEGVDEVDRGDTITIREIG